MLVLSRRESDKVLFPSLGITVEVLRVQGNKTRLGITAPDDVPIVRHEIANLKDIEFAPEKSKNTDRLRRLV
jgi:carbon storage regulator CsrA